MILVGDLTDDELRIIVNLQGLYPHFFGQIESRDQYFIFDFIVGSLKTELDGIVHSMSLRDNEDQDQKPTFDPPSLEDPSMCSPYFGILVVGTTKAFSGRLSFGVVNSAMKSVRACPFIVGHGMNSISNPLQ